MSTVLTNLHIDDQLLEQAQRLGGHPTKRATVNEALKKYVQRRKRLRALEDFGSISFDHDYDLKSARRMHRLANDMSGFPLVLATSDDHLEAARISNTCRRNGATCSAIDALIAALAVRRSASLFTTDGDFEDIAKHTTLFVRRINMPI